MTERGSSGGGSPVSRLASVAVVALGALLGVLGGGLFVLGSDVSGPQLFYLVREGAYLTLAFGTVGVLLGTVCFVAQDRRSLWVALGGTATCAFASGLFTTVFPTDWGPRATTDASAYVVSLYSLGLLVLGAAFVMAVRRRLNITLPGGLPAVHSWVRHALRGRPIVRVACVPAALAFGGATLLVFRLFTAFTLLAVGVTAGFLVYALLGREGGVTTSVLAGGDPRVPALLSIVFFASTAVGIVSLSSAYYSKPLVYYVCLAVAGGSIAVRELATDAHRSNVGLAFIYGVNTFASNQLAFPLGINGPDSGHHISLALEIFRSGHITTGGVYEGFPGQHVFATAGAFVSGTAPPLTYRWIGIIGLIVGIPVTYLLARQLTDDTTAIMAMLVYASMDYVVYRAGHPSKLAYALPILLFLFAVVVFLYEEVTAGRLVLFTLFAVSLVFTHHYTSVMAAIMLGSLAVGQRLEPKLLSVVPTAGVDPPSPQSVADRFTGRGHMLVVLFLIAFCSQFLYFSGFFQDVVLIGERYIEVIETYVDTIFVSDPGGNSGDATKQTPRFNAIPVRTLFINTIGSGLLAGLAVLGILSYLDRGKRLTVVLLTWFVTAALVMVFGVISDVPFALPNRNYVIVEMAGVGVFGAAGLVYLYRRLHRTGGARVAITVLAVVVVAFTFFSTASTIAGIETSPFNEDVGYNNWYGIADVDAAAEFADESSVNGRFRLARQYLQLNGSFDYSTARPGTIIAVTENRLSTGVSLGVGQGRIGSASYVFPERYRAGLGDTIRYYDNGPSQLYLVGGN
jgi:hypothetical protein